MKPTILSLLLLLYCSCNETKKHCIKFYTYQPVENWKSTDRNIKCYSYRVYDTTASSLNCKILSSSNNPVSNKEVALDINGIIKKATSDSNGNIDFGWLTDTIFNIKFGSEKDSCTVQINNVKIRSGTGFQIEIKMP